MRKYLFSKLSSLAAVSLFMFATGVFTSCTEEIDQSNRYTFTGETVADYLQNRPEVFSKFCYILGRADFGKEDSGNLLEALSTYGAYTCFAPTNEAIDSFIAQQYRKYTETLGTEDFIDTGIHSPELEELSDSMVRVIAKNHIIERAFLTVDLPEGEIPQSNMNSRYLSIAWPVNEETGRPDIMINNTSKILVSDAEVENGVVQTMESVLSFSNATIADLLGEQGEYSTFAEALELTGLCDSLVDYVLDPNYENEYAYLTYPGTQFGGNFHNLPYPKSKKQGFTLFVESNTTLAENNIHGIDELIAYANEWYGSDHFEGDVNLNDYTARNNPLNRFVAYHILKSRMAYDKFLFLSYDGDFNPEMHYGEFSINVSEYYETMLNKMIKVTKPFANSELANDLILNYTESNSTNEDIINVTVIPESQREEDFVGGAMNGVIHPVNKMLVYNEEEMKNTVLNERMRMNSTALFPELINNDIRWALPLADNKMGYYIPTDYIKDITVRNSSTALYVTWPHPCVGAVDWAVFQGDEFLANGVFDFEFNLPPVPAGTYEIRFGFSKSGLRGVTQFYVDGEIAGIPVDMKNLPSDIARKLSEVEDEDIYDKGIRNQGWMRGPASIMLTASASMRQSDYTYRRIIATKNLNGTREHKLRFKDVTKDGGSSSHENSFDYLELVPRSVITNPSKPEDKN